MRAAIDILTDKEKETLRLIVRGHDAKSAARELGLSVHTINERLREARRKLSVTSSREAARLLLEQEGASPEMLVDKQIGEAGAAGIGDPSGPLDDRHSGGRVVRRRSAWLIGGLIMSALFALMLATAPLVSDEHSRAGEAVADRVATSDEAVETAARNWLRLVDQGNWDASYEAAGSTFRGLNTPENWQDASIQARKPLGTVLAREAISFMEVPAPPAGLELVRFRTDFTGKAGVVETLTLQKEGDSLKVVGYYIN